MPIRSMTGFARVSRPIGSGELTLSIKSVNHKGLDMHFHMPPDFDAVEPALRTLLRKKIVRGHVQLQANYRRNVEGAAALSINEPMLHAYLEAFRSAAERFGIASKPDLNQALRIPGILENRVPAQAVDTNLEPEVISAAEEALEALEQFRTREGQAIEAELRMRTDAIRALVSEMEEIRHRAVPFFQNRLRERISELLGGMQMEPGRIVMEAAILADRSDISEELVRLKTHASQLDELIATDGESGKKLDFLLQEMNREANTVLSKTSGLGDPGLRMTELALAAKAEIDRIREQSLNVE